MSNVIDISTQLQKKQYADGTKKHAADIFAILTTFVDSFSGYEMDILQGMLRIPTTDPCFNHLAFDFAYDKKSLHLDFFSTLVEPKEVFLTLETKVDVDIPVLGRNTEPMIRQWLQGYLDQYGDQIVFSFEIVALVLTQLYSSSNSTIVEMTSDKLSVIQGTTNNRSLNYITINLGALIAEARVLDEILNAPQEETN